MPQIISTDRRIEALNLAVSTLRRGDLVAIPTETVYGLAADATNGIAVAKVFALKGRPSFNPLICHVDGMVMAQEHGIFNYAAELLARHFWPGPLTLVVPLARSSNVAELVTAGLGTVGLRCPQGFSRQIISALGRPLAAPSANRSGRISPTSAQHVAAEFSDSELLILDSGTAEVGLESTIVKCAGEDLILLRPGAITAEQIMETTGRPLQSVQDAKILAPGMMQSHYAPDAPVRLACATCGPDCAWLGFGNQPMPENAMVALNLSPSSNLVEAAANLYAYLKQLDAQKVEAICVAPIPEESIGVAINDRLRRAAAPRGSAEAGYK